MGLLTDTIAAIGPLDEGAAGEARERQDRLTKPRGALGALEEISAQMAGIAGRCPPPVPAPATVVVFAADHGVHAQRVSPWPQEVTAQMVRNFLTGGAVVNAFAKQVDAHVVVVDVGVASDIGAAAGPAGPPRLLSRRVRPGTADMTKGPAMRREEAVRALETGIEVAGDVIGEGSRCLLAGDMGIANTTASAALVAAFTGRDAAEVTGRGTGGDEIVSHKVRIVRRAFARNRTDTGDPVLDPLGDPLGVAAAVGGLEHAAIAGLVLGAAARRVPVLLDGVTAAAGALIAGALAPEAISACVAGHRSAEPGHGAALEHLGLRPIVDLELRLGEGTGALLALPILQAAVRALREVATFDSAGVTQKSD